MPGLDGPQPRGAWQAWRAERHVALFGIALQALLATEPGELCGLGRSCPSRLHFDAQNTQAILLTHRQ